MQMNSKPIPKRGERNSNIPFSDKKRFLECTSTSDTSNEQRMMVSYFESAGLQDLDEKVKLMMGKSPNLIRSGKKRASICKVCGKEGDRTDITDHIESNHLEGVSLPCSTCGNTYRSGNQLKRHKCSIVLTNQIFYFSSKVGIFLAILGSRYHKVSIHQIP